MGTLLSQLQSFWSRLTGNLYVQSLELEITRLRLENRALMNSILGIAGVPPVVTPVAPYGDDQAPPGNARNNSPKNVHQAALPLRKRSWQQVHKTWELESARKKDPSRNRMS